MQYRKKTCAGVPERAKKEKSDDSKVNKKLRYSRSQALTTPCPLITSTSFPAIMLLGSLGNDTSSVFSQEPHRIPLPEIIDMLARSGGIRCTKDVRVEGGGEAHTFSALGPLGPTGETPIEERLV